MTTQDARLRALATMLSLPGACCRIACIQSSAVTASQISGEWARSSVPMEIEDGDLRLPGTKRCLDCYWWRARFVALRMVYDPPGRHVLDRWRQTGALGVARHARY